MAVWSKNVTNQIHDFYSRDKSYNVGSIECILEELHQTNQAMTKWPFMDGLTIEAHEINDQPKTDVQVTFTQLHPLCNTLCAEVNPWCLMINQIESSLILKIDNGSLYSIKPYSVLVPPSLLNTTFYIGLTGRIIFLNKMGVFSSIFRRFVSCDRQS